MWFGTLFKEIFGRTWENRKRKGKNQSKLPWWDSWRFHYTSQFISFKINFETYNTLLDPDLGPSPHSSYDLVECVPWMPLMDCCRWSLWNCYSISCWKLWKIFQLTNEWHSQDRLLSYNYFWFRAGRRFFLLKREIECDAPLLCVVSNGGLLMIVPLLQQVVENPTR